MSRIMQNLVFLKQPPHFFRSDTSEMAGNMHLNRFCVGEDAAFEVFGVYNLKNDPTCSVSGFSLPDLEVGHHTDNKETSGK